MSCITSATLEAPFLRVRLGLDGARELVLDSPFDYAAQALVYVPTGLPEPRAPGAYERLADEIVALCELSRGRALVLTTSYRSLDELAPQTRRLLILLDAMVTDACQRLELDRSEFPGGRVEHEVEVEVAAADAPAVEAALREWLGRAGVPWRTAESKAQRLFEALEGEAG